MLRIDRNNQKLTVLDTPTLADASITERYDLQEYICNSPDAFFSELGRELFLIGKEVVPSKNVLDRIDVLALDKEGCGVIVELKRGNHKLHMFQAISYAGMISHWTGEDFYELLSEPQQEELADFLEVDKDEINRHQRIILVAEAYDYSLLVGAEWLAEQFGVDIACCRIAIASDSDSSAEYLVCSNVYPAPELASEAIARGRRGSSPAKSTWSSWKEALENVSNPDLISFYNSELQAGQECYLGKRILHYRIGRRLRWFVQSRRAKAYVWQRGRFEGDVEFWKKGLRKPDEVKPVKNEECLRMFLYSDQDFQFFKESATKSLSQVAWLGEEEGSEDSEEMLAE